MEEKKHHLKLYLLLKMVIFHTYTYNTYYVLYMRAMLIFGGVLPLFIHEIPSQAHRLEVRELDKIPRRVHLIPTGTHDFCWAKVFDDFCQDWLQFLEDIPIQNSVKWPWHAFV